MTMQIKDRFTIFGEDYDVVATTNDFFHPRDYGLSTAGERTSACWRGFYYKIRIDDKGMILESLNISTDGNKDKLLNGIRMIHNGSWNGEYDNLNMHLPFTGKTLFGRKQKYYTNTLMCEAAWAYAELIELEFQNGKLINKLDYSDQAKKFQQKIRFNKKIRELIDAYEYEDGTGSYNLKLWWLDYC